MVKSEEVIYMPRRGENIYKRKDGRWEGRYIKEYDKNNKAKYSSVYAQTYLEAKQKLAFAKAECSHKEKKIDRHSFKFYAFQWLTEMKPQIKHSTYVKYFNIIKNHAVQSLGDKQISEITTDEMRLFISQKMQSGNLNTQSGLAPKTVRDIVSVIKLVIKYADTFGETSTCDFEQITIKNTAFREHTISQTEQIRLIGFLMKDIDYTKLGILLCLYTGIRIGEICAIRFSDILIDEKTIRVTKTMQRLQTFSDSETKTKIVVTEPKSISSQREIPIPDFIADAIEKLNYRSNAYLLTGQSDKYIEPRTLEYRFKACLKKCGLEDYKFHQLRHRFATQCVELGFDIKSLSEILGHSNVNITLNRYVHSSMELKRLNMNKLQEAMIY